MRHSPELIRSLMHVVRLAVNHFRSQGNSHHGDMRPHPSTHRAQITTIRNQWAKCTTKTLPISAYPFNTTNDPFHPQVRPINDLPVHCDCMKRRDLFESILLGSYTHDSGYETA
ncbi:hypothetical protein Bbelb_257070 [Branchiostoma belcheri]|nr:hypothetical protein Bbelb_257070 [Branchiostoma belcheri]